MVVTAKNFIANTQSSQRAQAERNLAHVRASNSASWRSRSSFAWMEATSAGLRKGKRDLWTLSGKSTIRRRPRMARKMVMAPLMMKILWLLVSHTRAHTLRGNTNNRWNERQKRKTREGRNSPPPSQPSILPRQLHTPVRQNRSEPVRTNVDTIKCRQPLLHLEPRIPAANQKHTSREEPRLEQTQQQATNHDIRPFIRKARAEGHEPP